MIGRFFHTPGTKKFGFKPRFFDPDKEEREHRVRAIKAEMGVDVELGKKSSAITRGSFRQNNSTSKSRSRANRDSNRRLILIVIILLLLAYILLLR